MTVVERADAPPFPMTRVGILDGTNRALTYAALTVVLAAVFVPLCIFRVVDADEGAYLLAAKLVMQGKLLYHDFSYPQMPLLPYLYGAWMKLFGMTWYSSRFLSALFSIALGLLLYRQIARVTGRPPLAFLATIAFAFTGLTFSWYPLVKTFVFPTLMVFLSYAVLDSSIRWKYFLSGVCLGIAVSTRFYVGIVILTLAVEVVRREHGITGLRQLGVLAAGFVVALAPNLVLFAVNPDAFIFNILGHHAIRSMGSGPVGDFPQKIEAILAMLGIGATEGATSVQFSILLFMNVALIVSRVRMRQPLPASASITVLLIAVSLLPTPTYAQYACMPIPFMIVNAALLVRDLLADGAGTTAARRLKHVLVILFGAYVLVSAGDLHRYTIGWDTPPHTKMADWRIPTINRVSRAIDAQITPDNPLVITWWPGYLLESKATILPRTENHFNLWYSINMPAEDIPRYNYISFDELVWNIMNHTANVVALGNWVWDVKPRYRQILAQSGYVKVDEVGDTEIYRWSGKAR